MEVKVGVLLSGRGSNMIALVEAACDAGYEVVAVASDNPDSGGIGWASAHGLATLAARPKDLGGKAGFEHRIDVFLREAQVEVIALAGYMRLLSPGFVGRWPARILNIHPSLLPLYKGLDTHARAIAAGDADAGCSVHLVTDELDAGTVLGQARVPILADDTAAMLAARVLIAEHRLYPRTLSEYCRAMPSVPGQAPLDRVRQVALRLPDTQERLSHGQPTFFVADRQFAQVRDDHHGDGRHVVCVRISGADEQAMLLEAAATVYSRPAYLGTSGWVGVTIAGDVDWPLVEDRIARSWELAAPAALLEAGGR